MMKRLWQFFTYPSGNVLAMIDFALIGGIQICFAHDRPDNLEKVIFYVNWPATLIDRFLIGEFLAGILWPFFIYLQWLGVGFIAKNAAALVDRSKIKLP